MLASCATYIHRTTYNNLIKPVGLKHPNGFGLYDMHGNLQEWTADWWGCTFPDTSGPDPYCATPNTNNQRVLRSSNFDAIPNNAGVSYRYNANQSSTSDNN